MDDVTFHYRALAAAGDAIAITVVRGMELSGCKTLVVNENYGTLDMPFPDENYYPTHPMKQEMLDLSWECDHHAWYHRSIILKDIDNHK